MLQNPFGDPFQPGEGPSLSDIFRRRGGGGRRPIKPKTTEGDAQEGEAEEESQVPEESTQDKSTPEKIILKNPKWDVEKVGFNEETDISVEAEVPESQAHKTRVEFELFAKTPEGTESIAKCQGTIKAGMAKARMPVYIPRFKDELGNLLSKVEYFFTAKHSLSDLLKDENVVKQVDHLAERFLECHILQDVTFATGKSFLSPRNASALKTMVTRIKDWKSKHADGKLALFGHTDAVGEDVSNKKLSERRAASVFAFLTKDADAWMTLYDEEKWGLISSQELLKFLGHDPGLIDGKDGPKTQAAVKGFKSAAGLASNGQLDTATRKAMYNSFIDKCNADPVSAKEFDSIDGKSHAGCSEFNRVLDVSGESAENRRIALFFLKSNKNFPIQYPCKQGDVAPCQKQKARKGARRRPGFNCLFYDQLILEPDPKPIKEETTLKGRLFWNRIWDYMDETKPIPAIKEYLPGAKAELEIKKSGEADFKSFGSPIHLTDGIEKALVQPHEGCGVFEFKSVPKCDVARIKISLEYEGGKVVCVKGKTIKGNTKFKDETDFKIHTGKTVFHITNLDLSTVDWANPESDIGEVEIKKALFVDLCDAYKSVWTGYKRIKEMASREMELCQINFPEDSDITVSNAGEEMQLTKDDLKDRAVILHEYGHFIGTKMLGGLVHPGYGYNDDPTNSHSGDTLEHYEAAWNEGHATFLSCALTDNPHYHDGYDTTLDFHLDSDGTTLGPHCEGSIQEALWAIYKFQKTDFKEGFWKAFTDRSIRTCHTIFDFFENWRDLKLPKLDKVVETFKDYGMEFGYQYPGDKFKNVAPPKVYDGAKKEFAAIGELHTHKGSLGAGTLVQYNEEFYNRNKHFNAGALKAGSSIASPKVSVGKGYIAPERFQVKV